MYNKAYSALTALCSLVVLGQSQTYNVLDAFSPSSSTVGPWTLGETDAPGGTFQAMDHFLVEPNLYQNGPLSRWSDVNEVDTAAFGFYRNYNNYQLNGGDPASSIIPANDWMIHPEDSAFHTLKDPVARFTAPTASLYKVTWSAARLSEYPGGSVISLIHNGLVVDSIEVTSNGYQYTSMPNSQISCNVGDTIDFEVNEGTDFVSGDSTGLHATIQAVPEPASVPAILFGLAVLSRRRRRPRLNA